MPTNIVKLLKYLSHSSHLFTRSGGIPLRLTYFLPPYELLCQDTGSLLAATPATLQKGKLGFSATLALRPSPEPALLPLSSLLQGQDWGPITQANSVPLPAQPSLALERPLPMSWALIQRLSAVTGLEWLEEGANSPLLTLVTKQASGGVLDPSNNRY